MNLFEKTLLKRDEYIRRRVLIDEEIYLKLEELSEIYDASVNKLINIAILEFLKDPKIIIYKRNKKERTRSHNFAIRESAYKQLEGIKTEYGLSIFKLINIAIYNAIYDDVGNKEDKKIS